MILATDHRRPHTTPEEPLIVDIDLSILGRDPATFDAYDRAIRAEYAHVPDDAYRIGRGKVLQHFLNRTRLYYTPWFFEQYEATARVNLQQALQRLGA
jgi:predicted metal-dependent HD superfamily phosphohydrolase